MSDETVSAPVPVRDVRRRGWDFGLTVATVAILGLLGVQSFVGTIYTWWATRSIAGWQQTGYNDFVTLMNQVAAPLVVALVVVMGLCVPKRIFAQRALVMVSVAMVAIGIGVGAYAGSLQAGLATYLALAALIQIAVVVMTIAGVRGPSYLTEGRLTKTGSGLLHLGFIGVAFVVVALQRSNLMLPVFAASALCLAGGTALAFYAEKLAWRHVTDDTGDAEDDQHERAEEPGASDEPDELGMDQPSEDVAAFSTEPTPHTTRTPPDRRIALIAAVTTFVVSLPAMYEIGVFAIFASGFLFWIIPWVLAAFTGTALLPQGALGGAITGEFDGPIIAFAFWASVQNALIAWWLARSVLAGRREADAQAPSDDDAPAA